MPLFPDEYVANGWVTTVIADGDHMHINDDAVEAQYVRAYVNAPRRVTGTATIAERDRDILVDTTSASDFTLPPATAGQIKRLHLRNPTVQAIGLIPDPDTSDTIDGVAGAAAPGFYVGPLILTVWCGTDGAWHTDRGVYAALIEVAGNTIPALDTRIDALEAIATTPLSSTTGTTLSWEAQERVRLANTGTTHCLVTLNGDTTEWPVGRARALSQYGSTTGGFTIAVPSGHKLNTVTNGTSGVIGTSAADDGVALFTIMVTREASDEWSWA